jgi:hypothetical protein
MTIWTELASIEARAKISEELKRRGRIDILVVTDGIVSFGPEHDPRNLNEDHFGMSHLIGVLEQVGHVTKAHRNTDPLTAPHVLEGFHFDEHDLSAYDQIWLLGYNTGQLPPSEQAAIARFMNRGGGVFATGDHGSLGSALAGTLPRVRSMRHWSSPPPPLGPTRVDTTRPDVNNVVVFENQSDDIPQQLRLKWYEWSHSRWTREVYPHPLLCSRAGPITEFPDHMHEGEVVVPSTLTEQMNLPNLDRFDEYPADADGVRVSPEIVAWGWTTGRADPEVMHTIHTGDPGTANQRWTGTIGAYDGHRVGVGRVVVHSTWHHFFDINLIGDNAANRPGFTDPRAPLWRQGFLASANGQRVLSQIDQYYRKVVLWLSPGAGVHLRFEALAVQVAMSHSMREVLEGGSRELSASAIGTYAWEHAMRYMPPCTVMQLSLKALEDLIPVRVLPWEVLQRGPIPDWPVPPKQMAQAALGGAMLAFSKLKSAQDLHGSGAHGVKALREGALTAVKHLVESELRHHRAAHEVLEQAMSALGAKPKGST